MAEYTLFTQPMSRGQIARWALHEANADYAHHLVDLSAKPAALLAVNPMGKVPALVHHAPRGVNTGDVVRAQADFDHRVPAREGQLPEGNVVVRSVGNCEYVIDE